MSQQIINIGSGNNTGDGDPLRQAFTKTKENFEELYSFAPLVASDIDHSDPSIAGSLANALQTLSTSGGGTVRLAPGTYKLESGTLNLPTNCTIEGSGKGNTFLEVSHSDNAIQAGNALAGTLAKWSVSQLTLQLPTNSSAYAIYTPPRKGNVGQIYSIGVTGGNSLSWGVVIDANNIIEISNLVYQGNGSGIRFSNPTVWMANYGDSVITNCDIYLTSPNTTGIFLESPNSPTYKINNILISRCEILAANQGVVQAGTIGVHLKNVARVCLVNVDIERLDSGLLQESGTDGGSVAGNNAFFQVYFLGCNDDYVEFGNPVSQTILGGYGDFSDYQRLPSANILVSDGAVGDFRVTTNVRNISKSAGLNSFTLAPLDSGNIYTNEGTDDTVTFNLPPANASKSMEFEFHLANPGHAIHVVPTGNDLIRPLQNATNTPLVSDVTWGQVLRIRNINAFVWSVIDMQGNWT